MTVDPYPAPDRAGSLRRQPPAYSAFVPVFMILVILILSGLKDIVSLLQHKKGLEAQRAQAMETLRFAGRQAEFVESLHHDLVKLAPSDPAAAAVIAEFFPPPTPSPGPDQPNANAASQK